MRAELTRSSMLINMLRHFREIPFPTGCQLYRAWRLTFEFSIGFKAYYILQTKSIYKPFVCHPNSTPLPLHIPLTSKQYLGLNWVVTCGLP